MLPGREKMHKKIHSGIMLTLLLTGILTLAFNTQPVKASGTIYIRADGSIDPSTAPIQRDRDVYTFTDNINDEIVVEKDNIVVDGAGYILRGLGSGRGIYLTDISNVTIKNLRVHSFYWGIYLENSSDNSIFGNRIYRNSVHGIMVDEHSNNNRIFGNRIWHNDDSGIELIHSSNNIISGNEITDHYIAMWLWGFSNSNIIFGNKITDNDSGIWLGRSSKNTLTRNRIANNGILGILLCYSSNNNIISGNEIESHSHVAFPAEGIRIDDSSNNTLTGNNIARNADVGILISGSSTENSVLNNTITRSLIGLELRGESHDNTIKENNITRNDCGISISLASGNDIYHNNFLWNTEQIGPLYHSEVNMWDDGYPSGGNYWSDQYHGECADHYVGPDQDIPGSDGIVDTPYVINADNQDNYPLMEPWSPFPRTIDKLKIEIENCWADGEIDNQGIVTSLLAELNAAQKLIDDGKIDQAKNILEAFINEVEAQSGRHITLEAADILIESAEYILSHL